MNFPIYYKKRQRRIPFLLGVFGLYFLILLSLLIFNVFRSQNLFKAFRIDPEIPSENPLPPSPPKNETIISDEASNSIKTEGLDINWEIDDGSAEIRAEKNEDNVSIEATVNSPNSGDASMNINEHDISGDIRVRNNIDTKIDTGGNSTEDLLGENSGRVNSGEGTIDIQIENRGGAN